MRPLPDGASDYQRWLHSLRAGDEVAIDRFRGELSLAKVDRHTDTLLVIGGHRYRRKDGLLSGTTGSLKYRIWKLVQPTETVLRAYRLGAAKQLVQDMLRDASIDVERWESAVKVLKGK